MSAAFSKTELLELKISAAERKRAKDTAALESMLAGHEARAVVHRDGASTLLAKLAAKRTEGSNNV